MIVSFLQVFVNRSTIIESGAVLDLLNDRTRACTMGNVPNPRCGTPGWFSLFYQSLTGNIGSPQLPDDETGTAISITISITIVHPHLH